MHWGQPWHSSSSTQSSTACPTKKCTSTLEVCFRLVPQSEPTQASHLGIQQDHCLHLKPPVGLGRALKCR